MFETERGVGETLDHAITLGTLKQRHSWFFVLFLNRLDDPRVLFGVTLPAGLLPADLLNPDQQSSAWKFSP